jgi:hypothetical protein
MLSRSFATFAMLLSLLLLSTTVSATKKKDTVKSKYSGFQVELSPGINGCIGDWCEDSAPSMGIDVTTFMRSSKHLGWGMNYHYGVFSREDFESVHYYSINIEGRLYLPLGRLQLYTTTSLGYITYMMSGNEDSTHEFEQFRATGPGFGFGFGAEVSITKSIKLGFVARLWVPIWSEACSTDTTGKMCIEPQDESVKLDLIPWFTGIKLIYSFSN